MNVIEVGYGASYIPRAEEAKDRALEECISYVKRLRSAVGDAYFVGPIEVKDGPTTDKLGRIKTVGAYARMASDDYKFLEGHFACHRWHVPERISADFIKEVIDLYVEQMADDNG